MAYDILFIASKLLLFQKKTFFSFFCLNPKCEKNCLFFMLRHVTDDFYFGKYAFALSLLMKNPISWVNMLAFIVVWTEIQQFRKKLMKAV